MQAAAAFDTFDQVMLLSGRTAVDQIDRSLIDGENICGSENTDIGDRGFRGRRARAVAVNRHAAQHIDKDNLLSKVITDGFGGFCHRLHQHFLAGPLIPRQIHIRNGMNLLLIPTGPQRMVTGSIIVIAVIVDVLRKKANSKSK